MAVRMLASDLDGTLLNEESKIDEATVKAVRTAQSYGMRFIAATGRSWTTAHMLFQEAGLNVDYVLLNGAEFRTSSGKVIYRESIESFTAKRIVDYLLSVGADFELNTDIGDYSTDTSFCTTASEISDLDHFRNIEPKIMKIFVFSDKSALLEKYKVHLKCIKGITVTSSSVHNIEITSEAASKGKMLKKAAEFFKVSEEDVVVFGDGENDESMFWEFWHSRAVENAVPNICFLAEKIIDSNRNNGVAKEINHILGGI